MNTQRHRVAASNEIVENQLTQVKVDTKKLLLSRVNGEVHAVIDNCPHFGMSMRKGTIENGVVTCPFHGSRFNFQTGENVDWITGIMGKKMPDWTCKLLSMGKQPEALALVKAEEVAGEIYVEL